MRFEWDDKYSVGDEVIDGQHKRLFELGNEIESADLCNSGFFINELLEYAKVHFVYEEEHMGAIDFPSLLEHKELHRHLISDLLNLVVVEMSESDFQKFKEFLYSWLMEHVLKFDQRYFEYIKKGKIK